MRTLTIVAFSGVALAWAAATPRYHTRPVGDYRIGITNSMAHSMDFTYRDAVGDTAEHSLGSVGGGSRSVFTISGSTRPTIVVIESGLAMPGYTDSARVTLRPDTIVEIAF